MYIDVGNNSEVGGPRESGGVVKQGVSVADISTNDDVGGGTSDGVIGEASGGRSDSAGGGSSGDASGSAIGSSSGGASGSTRGSVNAKAKAASAVRVGAQDRLNLKLNEIHAQYEEQGCQQHKESVALAREKMAQKQSIASVNLQLLGEKVKREANRDDADLHILLAKAQSAEIEAKIAVFKARKELQNAGVDQNDIDALFLLEK